MKILSYIGCSFVNVYRCCISPFKCPCCRFQPTCSQYAKEALQKHSFFKALLLISKRLLKCHPWGSFGYDPVPEPVTKRKIEK